MAVVIRRLKLRILACRFLTRNLLGCRRHFRCALCGSLLFCSRLGFHAVRTIKTGLSAVHLVVRYGAIDVGVMNDGSVHTRDGGVVMKRVSYPVAAPVSIPPIAMTVVNAAVETYSRPPIARVKNVSAVVPSPPGGGPQQANARRCDPNARRPIITTGRPTPISGSPDVAG